MSLYFVFLFYFSNIFLLWSNHWVNIKRKHITLLVSKFKYIIILLRTSNNKMITVHGTIAVVYIINCNHRARTKSSYRWIVMIRNHKNVYFLLKYKKKNIVQKCNFNIVVFILNLISNELQQPTGIMYILLLY